jgi:hypothetical protein
MEFDPLPESPNASELESAPELAPDTVPTLELEPAPDMEFDPLLDVVGAPVPKPTPEFAPDIEPELELDPLPESPNAPAPKAQKGMGEYK